MTLTVLVAVLVLIALAAPRYGADSRSYREAPQYSATLIGDLRAAWWRIRYAVGRSRRDTPRTPG